MLGLFGELSLRRDERSRLVLLGRLRKILRLLSWWIVGVEFIVGATPHAKKICSQNLLWNFLLRAGDNVGSKKWQADRLLVDLTGAIEIMLLKIFPLVFFGFLLCYTQS